MSSSLKNRVDPWGRLQSHERRTGTRMGNRGILHNAQREVVRYSAATAWLCCSLEFKGIKRQIFQVDPKPSYSELFFLDEATALAAGHRPCNDCQPFRFQQFKQAWCSAHYPDKTHRQLLIGDVDEQLKGERIGPGNEKPTFRFSAPTLPVGTFFSIGAEAYLVTSGGHFLWSQNGYTRATLPKLSEVDVLTPKSVVAVLRAGYVPSLHPSADA